MGPSPWLSMAREVLNSQLVASSWIQEVCLTAPFFSCKEQGNILHEHNNILMHQPLR